MRHTIQEIAQSLKQARQIKGLSQRALARLADVPQGHISKIENGGVDLRLSSLVEIARALDMEVTLIPRKNLLAVQSIVRQSLANREQGTDVKDNARPMYSLEDEDDG